MTDSFPSSSSFFFLWIIRVFWFHFHLCFASTWCCQILKIASFLLKFLVLSMFSFVQFSLLSCWISLCVIGVLTGMESSLKSIWSVFLAFHIDELCFFSLETWNLLGTSWYNLLLLLPWLLLASLNISTWYTYFLVVFVFLIGFMCCNIFAWYLSTALLDQVVQSCWSIPLAAVLVDLMCWNIFAWHLSFST